MRIGVIGHDVLVRVLGDGPSVALVLEPRTASSTFDRSFRTRM